MIFVQPIDYFLAVWFVLAGTSTAYVAQDQFRGRGCMLFIGHLGRIGLLLDVLADKETSVIRSWHLE